MRRWEIERGLPVHRMPGSARGVIYAFTHELEEWLRPQGQPTATREGNTDQAGPKPVAVSGLLADRLNDEVETGDRRQNGNLAGSILAEAEDFRPHAAVLPWVVAGVLAVTVFAGVYSYRQTARFAARAAGSREAGTSPAHIPTPEVQDLYLKGRYNWSKRTPEDLNKAADYFTQAIVKDPAYASAFVGLADCYNLLREFSVMPPDEALPRALAAAQKAVELDDSSAEAHNSLAFATYYWNWDAATADREFRRGLELNPNFVQGHHWYATFLMASARFPEALDQIEQARKLDPSSTSIEADKALILRDAGRGSEAFALLKQLESTDPALATTHSYLARIHLDRKDYQSFIAESKQAARLRRDEAALSVASAAERGFAAGGVNGMRESMIPVQKEMFDRGLGSAYDLAANYAQLGNKEDALRYLQAAYEKREIGLLYLSRNPDFISLHDDSGYKEITERVAAKLSKPQP